MAFSEAIHIDWPAIRPDTSYFHEEITGVFKSGLRIRRKSLIAKTGDDSHHISLGTRVNFMAYPRSGEASLTVAFENKVFGDIDEYYWLCNDGQDSYTANPSFIYGAKGNFDVTLRIKSHGNYYSIKKKEYIVVTSSTVIDDDTIIAGRATRCIRFAIKPEQGTGFYEMPGANMPMPESGAGVLLIYDSNNQSRGLVLDAKYGKWYDVTTRNGPQGSGLVKSDLGKDGLDFDRYLKLREDRGNDEMDFLKVNEAHLFLRPEKELNRSKTGFNANGYPTGMQVKLDFFTDGEPTTTTTTIKNIPQGGDLKTDRKVDGNRIQIKVTANRGSHWIVNRLIKYIVSRRAAAPDKRVSNEMDWQEELSNTMFWLSFIENTLYNRVDGLKITIPGMEQVSGVVGTETAIRINGAYSLPSMFFEGGSLFLWTKNPISLTINSIEISTEDIITVNNFTLKYAAPISRSSSVIEGSIVITPTGGPGKADIEDIRVFAAAEISDEALEYYQNDVENNSGAIVLP